MQHPNNGKLLTLHHKNRNETSNERRSDRADTRNQTIQKEKRKQNSSCPPPGQERAARESAPHLGVVR